MHTLNGMGWGMGYGWFIGLVIFAFAAWFIYRLIQSRPDSPEFQHKSALDILNERFAGGEISKEQYEEIKKSIS